LQGIKQAALSGTYTLFFKNEPGGQGRRYPLGNKLSQLCIIGKKPRLGASHFSNKRVKALNKEIDKAVI